MEWNSENKNTVYFKNNRVVTDENGIATINPTIKKTGTIKIIANVWNTNNSVTFIIHAKPLSTMGIILIVLACVFVGGAIVGAIYIYFRKKRTIKHSTELEVREGLLSN